MSNSESNGRSYPYEEYLFCALDDGDLRVIRNGSCRSSTARDRAAHAIARGQPQPVDVGTDKQPEQMRQDYATGLMGAQRDLLQQNTSGLGRQEEAVGRELNGYVGPR